MSIFEIKINSTCRSKLENTKSCQGVYDVHHVGHHGRQDVNVAVVKQGDDLQFGRTKLNT